MFQNHQRRDLQDESIFSRSNVTGIQELCSEKYIKNKDRIIYLINPLQH